MIFSVFFQIKIWTCLYYDTAGPLLTCSWWGRWTFQYMEKAERRSLNQYGKSMQQYAEVHTSLNSGEMSEISVCSTDRLSLTHPFVFIFNTTATSPLLIRSTQTGERLTSRSYRERGKRQPQAVEGSKVIQGHSSTLKGVLVKSFWTGCVAAHKVENHLNTQPSGIKTSSWEISEWLNHIETLRRFSLLL